MIYCQELISGVYVAEAKQLTIENFQTMNLCRFIFWVFKYLFKLNLLYSAKLSVTQKTKGMKDVSESFNVCVKRQKSVAALIMFNLSLFALNTRYFQV
jgi:hypothetical protein